MSRLAFLRGIGRKPFRKYNRVAAERKGFAPLESFVSNNYDYAVPEGFKRHDGTDAIGTWQRDFLIQFGLKPHHRLLDIGCGDLRGGIPLLRYLAPNGYVGVDSSSTALFQGTLSLTEFDWKRQPRLFIGGDFSFERIGGTFNVAWAHSVFTHIDLSLIGKCLASLYEVLEHDGVFLATYFRPDHPQPWSKPAIYRRAEFLGPANTKFTYSYRNPFHHQPHILACIAEDIGFATEFLEGTTVKRQSVACFRKVPRRT